MRYMPHAKPAESPSVVPGMNTLNSFGVKVGTAVAVVLALLGSQGGIAAAKSITSAGAARSTRPAGASPSIEEVQKKLAELQAELAATKAELAEVRSDVATHDQALTELQFESTAWDESASAADETDSFDDPDVFSDPGPGWEESWTARAE